MKQRVLRLIGVATTVVAASLAMATLAGQAPTPQQNGPAAKTSWGEPDLQGLWSDEYQIPLQRPAKYAGKEFFTDAERLELDKERAAKPFGFGDKRAERGTERDLAGAYDSRVFLMHRHAGKRTSLIVDPPDGRLPPFTPQVQQRQKEIRDWQLALIQSTESCKNKWRGCEGGTYNPVPSERRFDQFKHYPA